MTDTLLDQILRDFTTAFNSYYPAISLWALGILGTLTVLQFCYVAWTCTRERNTIGMLEALLVGLLRIGILYMIMDRALEWGTDIIQTGQDAGASISGMSPGVLTPSGIYTSGLTLVTDLLNARSWGMWFHLVDDAVFFIVVLMIWVTWAIAAAIYLWLLIEAVFIVVTGPVYICFSAFEYTWPILFQWGGRLLAIAVKILAMLLVLSVGMTLVNQWITNLNGLGVAAASNLIYYATVTLVESLSFLTMVWYLPNIAAQMVRTHLGGGGTSFSETAASSSLGTAASAAKTTVTTAASGGGKQLGQYIQRKLSS